MRFESYIKAQQAQERERLAWLMTKWEDINLVYFDGKLPKPTMSFGRDMGLKFRRIGGYYPMQNSFIFTPKLFNVAEDKVIEVLKHEIAHQASWVLDKERSPHGPIWRMYCRKMGIDPSRLDLSAREMWLSDQEKAEYQKQKEQEAKQKEFKRKEEDDKIRIRYVDMGHPVQFLNIKNKKWLAGVIVMVKDRAGKTCLVLTDKSLLGGYWNVPTLSLFELSPEQQSLYKTPEWTEAAKKVRDQINAQKSVSSIFSGMRRRRRY